MAIVPQRGKFTVRWIPKTASTAFAIGDLVTVLSTAAGVGTLAQATSTSASVIGTILKKIAATDSDYASATKVPVLVADGDAEWLALTTGAAQTDVGEFIDVTDNVTLNIGSYTYGVAEVLEYVDSTHVIVRLVKKSGPAITTA